MESTMLNDHTAPKKSLVQVLFPAKDKTMPYFNDTFDLKVGDFVYVEGEFAGQIGRVTQINYHFKIKLCDYWKVIAVVDTDIHGQFHLAGSHLITFDPNALPAGQVITWFKWPVDEDEDVVCCYDDKEHFPLDDLDSMNVTPAIAQRGHKYYTENRVRYLCLNGSHGYAIVEGGEIYTLDFEYQDGQISRLLCDCPCGFNCKHEFAAMLQLRETLELIEKHYADEYKRSGYFAAITKGAFFSFVIDGNESGSFIL